MSVDLRPGESQESLLRRFRKSVSEARVLPLVRQKRWFTSKSEINRIKKQKAIRKIHRFKRRGSDGVGRSAGRSVGRGRSRR